MIRTFTEEVHCTPTEIADEFWEKTAKEQIIILRCLNTRFFKDKEKGLMQMARMSNELNNICDESYKADVKHFVTKLYEYVVKE